MDYAKRSGFELFAFVDGRDAAGNLQFGKLIPFTEDGKAFCIHYSRKPLGKNGKIPDKAYFSEREIERNDPNLIATVEALGDKANGFCANLDIVEIPDGVQWEIDEYDGIERVDEVHRSWS